MGRPWTTWAQVQGAMPAPASAAKRPNVSCQPPQRHQGQHTRHRLRAHRPPHPDNLGMGPFAPPCGGPSHLWPWGYGPLHSPGAMGKTEAPDARQEGGGPPRLWARWEHALALRRDGQRPQRHNAPALAVPGRGTPYDPAWAPSRAARLGGKRDKTRRGKRTLAPRWQAQGDAGQRARPGVCPAQAGVFSRRATSQGKSQSPVARSAGGRETHLLKPLASLICGRGASLQAVAHAHAQVAPQVRNPGGRACNRAGAGRRGRRRLAEAADHSGGVGATAGRQGHAKQLAKPAASRRAIGGSQGGGRTGPPGHHPKMRGGRRGP